MHIFIYCISVFVHDAISLKKGFTEYTNQIIKGFLYNNCINTLL